MADQRELPLFGWTPPTADVIPFPTSKRVGKIRRTAQHVVEGTGKSAAYQWNRAIDGLRSQMERAGVHEDRIAAEVAAFQRAVEIEVTRRSRGAMRIEFEDGGAA